MDLAIDVFARGLITVIAVIGLTRFNGLRSFSKISSFDFSLTVAFGSIIGGILLSPDSNLWLGALAVATVFAIQYVVAKARTISGAVEDAVDNCPILLMEGETIFHEALKRARVTEDDLRGKLREANVLAPSQVQAVVMEATGDVSVLHSMHEDETIDLEYMLRGVERVG